MNQHQILSNEERLAISLFQRAQEQKHLVETLEFLANKAQENLNLTLLMEIKQRLEIEQMEFVTRVKELKEAHEKVFSPVEVTVLWIGEITNE